MWFLTFLSVPPGSWLYTLALLAALEAPAALALQRWGLLRGRPGEGGRGQLFGRLALAGGSLFLLRVAGMLAALLIPPNSHDALIILAPLDRATQALTVMALAWALAYPQPEPRADAAAAALAAVGLAGLGVTWAVWAAAVRGGAAFYNGSGAETAWVLAIGLLAAGGLWVLYQRRPAGWPLGLGLLGLLLAADLFHYLYPVAGSSAAGSLRWAELIAVPAAMVMLYRLALSGPVGEPVATELEQPAPKFKPRPVWRQVAETLLIAGVVYFALEVATGRFRVDGPSMQPNLYTGQYVLADKIAYRLGSPQRGDVIVLAPPIAKGEAFIKRLMGLPGDTITIRGGKVWINGQLATEPYIAAPPDYSGSWTLGPDQYFVLGDNRNDSSDSHVWGSVTRADITGKALVVYWPPAQVRVVPHYAFAAGR
ncbi:MAG: signal peptidase I [Anaerolineales bacterium]